MGLGVRIPNYTYLGIHQVFTVQLAFPVEGCVWHAHLIAAHIAKHHSLNVYSGTSCWEYHSFFCKQWRGAIP